MLFKVIKKEQQKELSIKKFNIEQFIDLSLSHSKKYEIYKDDNKKSFEYPEKNRSENKDIIDTNNKIDKENDKTNYKEGYDNGFKKGYEDGVVKGEKEAKKELEKLRENYMETIKKIEKLRENIYKDAESDMVSIVKEAIKKVISANINNSEEFILNVLKDTINDNIESKKLVIKVSPEDYQYLTDSKEELEKNFPGREINLVKDSSITRGGCIIETDFGETDSTVETKLEEVLKVLEDTNE